MDRFPDIFVVGCSPPLLQGRQLQRSSIKSGGIPREREVSSQFFIMDRQLSRIFISAGCRRIKAFFCSLSVLYHHFPVNTTTNRLQCVYRPVTDFGHPVTFCYFFPSAYAPCRSCRSLSGRSQTLYLRSLSG